jgi:hypothetical protein
MDGNCLCDGESEICLLLHDAWPADTSFSQINCTVQIIAIATIPNSKFTSCANSGPESKTNHWAFSIRATLSRCKHVMLDLSY